VLPPRPLLDQGAAVMTRRMQAKICPYVPSTQGRIGQLARFAGITAADVVLDIGCGDGRALLALAEAVGCKGIGIDIDPELVEIAECTARAAEATSPGVASLLRYEAADMCAPAGCAGAIEGDEEPATLDAGSDASKLQTESHSTDALVGGREEHGGQSATGWGQRSPAVNKLDEYFMRDGVTVVLIYLIADALVLLYPHLQAAIQAHVARQQQQSGVNTIGAKTSPIVRVVTQVYHYDFGGVASFFSTDLQTGTRALLPAQALAPEAEVVTGEGPTVSRRDEHTAKHEEHEEHEDEHAPAAKDVPWKLLMYSDAVFRSHPATGISAASVHKISEHQVLITRGAS
jgi:hypothetical protein